MRQTAGALLQLRRSKTGHATRGRTYTTRPRRVATRHSTQPDGAWSQKKPTKDSWAI